jgi:predicted MPP superfamily phosphohydrolase
VAATLSRTLRALLTIRFTPRLLWLPLLFAPLACGRAGRVADARAAADSAENPADVYGVSAAQNVVVTPVEIEVAELPPGWSGLKIAVLSDFQLGLWADNEKVAAAAVQQAVAQHADLYLLLGDYVARGGDYAALGRVLEPLRGRPVMAVLGHVDEALEGGGEGDTLRVRTVAALERAGVTVLRNSRAEFTHGGSTAYIAGLEPWLAQRADWKQADVWNSIPGGPNTILVLAHMPATAVILPTDRYPVMLSGHTFCGQVEVPGTPRLAWFNTSVLPGTAYPATTRIWRVHGATLFATCGLGYSFVPIRFGAPPEVALITLRAVGGAPRPAVVDSAASQAGTDSLIRSYQQRDTITRDTAAADSTG